MIDEGMNPFLNPAGLLLPHLPAEGCHTVTQLPVPAGHLQHQAEGHQGLVQDIQHLQHHPIQATQLLDSKPERVLRKQQQQKH